MPRFISMRDFSDKASILLCQQPEYADNHKIVALGQCIGHVIGAEKKTSILPDGTSKDSICLHGAFEATNYKTGNVIEASQIYLPSFYAEEIYNMYNPPLDKDGNVVIKGELNKGDQILFGVEIGVRATGKPIPIAYEVRNITQRAKSNALQALKQELSAKGVLHKTLALPASAPAPVTIEHDVGGTDNLPIDGEVIADEHGGADQPEAAAALTHDKAAKGGKNKAA